ncbi:9625_t:CDS:10 [Acaulospora morrowiae]|uniref:U6 snRNA phosphodiesterase n=1 Tax=Acaulospora morrowiae TaxID=94023 RepID=A0A9N9BIU1_9GLOM|nr:9625_t:CDS:10 [Acaulospora morrowiae]
MQGLVDYDSSSSDESQGSVKNACASKTESKTGNSRNSGIVSVDNIYMTIDSGKRKSETEDEDSRTSKRREPKKLPPLPPEFLSLYQDKKYVDNPEIHQGRIRATPHVEGNWATHVYMEVMLPDEFKDLIHEIKTCAQNIVNDGGVNIYSCIDGDSKLHISLSRPLFLKYFQIDQFWDKLQKGFANEKRFTLSFTELEYFVNDEETRSFLSFKVGRGVNELKELLKHVNKVARDFRQKEFYTNPYFHASILWSVGGSTIDGSLRDAIKETGYESIIREFIFIIDRMNSNNALKRNQI